MSATPAYSVGVYRDAETGRSRLAVMCHASRVFYFPKRYGRVSADRLAASMNKAAP